MRRREGLELAPLLERQRPRSAFHLPLFTAVVHNYPGMVQQLLEHGLELTPAITTEHMEVPSLPISDGCMYCLCTCLWTCYVLLPLLAPL